MNRLVDARNNTFYIFQVQNYFEYKKHNLSRCENLMLNE